MQKKWVALFSQTGSEICEIADKIGRWPDLIITNHRPKHLRTIDKRIPEELLRWTENKPLVHEYRWLLSDLEDPVITLHGWLRIMPPEICERYSIFNGHPGLITEYPELKGKDPQVRAHEAKHPVAGAVLHRVTAGVDEGKVLMEERFNAWNLELNELFHILKDRSIYMWIIFLKRVLW